MHRIVVGVTGASGMPLVENLLRLYAGIKDLEVHLIVSAGAEVVMQSEFRGSDLSLVKHVHTVHSIKDMTAGPSSGSWQHDGMIICPCSMSSLASIASGAGVNLIHRAADVTLKERKKLVIVPRETPLTMIHLRNMQTVTEAGAVIAPFCPAYYDSKTTIENMMQHFAGRLLDQLRIENSLCARWRDNM
ncbi:4-hydroxy-3-polyprenylbenzoate decarboxylase [Maridesulfovibrio ferrireducens]|uniref:Flavin prenyltransferase UbiX n=1 Tax=Maridesulfovibrio ferrireducens TaxID=246191 RepID=A0A1G9EYB7_9BACT|nr:UbiX family flavin prenyltransferase [Maridesulfovibrio ferrireducens]SDK81028.1 4-hydroxy-3-polyprenylbenzoate decarboxylase [Maridesulfovibrio ferrireducens]